MGVVRQFHAICDTCLSMEDTNHAWVSELKRELKEDGWRVGNKLTCPACLGKDPDYWGFTSFE